MPAICSMTIPSKMAMSFTSNRPSFISKSLCREIGKGFIFLETDTITSLSQPFQGVAAAPKPRPVRLQRSSLTPPLQQGNLIAASFLHRAQVALPPLRQRFGRFHLHSPSASPLPPHRVKPSNRTNQSCEGQLLRFHSSLSETANAQENS